MYTLTLYIGAQVDVIYTDFAKAFDTVPHYRLLYKLKLYNISDKLIAWIHDFLCNRKQSICVCKNAASTKLSCRRHYSQLTAVSCQSFCLLPVPLHQSNRSVISTAVQGRRVIILPLSGGVSNDYCTLPRSSSADHLSSAVRLSALPVRLFP